MPRDSFVEFLVSSSEAKLKEAVLAQLGEASNTRKQIAELLDKWAAETTRGEILSWFAANRGDLAWKLAEARDPFRLPRRFNYPLDASKWRRRRR